MRTGIIHNLPQGSAGVWFSSCLERWRIDYFRVSMPCYVMLAAVGMLVELMKSRGLVEQNNADGRARSEI